MVSRDPRQPSVKGIKEEFSQGGRKCHRWNVDIERALTRAHNECEFGFLHFWGAIWTSWNCITGYWGYRTQSLIRQLYQKHRNLKWWQAVMVGKLFLRSVSASLSCLCQDKCLAVPASELWGGRKKEKIIYSRNCADYSIPATSSSLLDT